MTSTQIVLISLLVPFIIGLIRLVRDRQELVKRKAFVREYLIKFSEFANKNTFDNEAYYWLTHKAFAIQTELGRFGIMNYKPPFAGYMIRDYPAIINLLPEIRHAKSSRSISGPGEIYSQKVTLCQEVLVRYEGVLDTWLDASAKELRNPLIWFREGVQFILLLPIFILHWFGLVSSSFVNKIVNIYILKLVSDLIAFIGFFGAIVTIVLGWEDFRNLMIDLWRALFF